MNTEALLNIFGKKFPILSLSEIAVTCFSCKKNASFSDHLCYCYENILGNISITLIAVCHVDYLSLQCKDLVLNFHE